MVWLVLCLASEYEFRTEINNFDGVCGSIPEIRGANVRAARTSDTPNCTSRANTFRKGQKRDKSAFEIFLRASKWEQFRIQFISTTKAQGCSEILNAHYYPITPGDAEWFNELQIFMYDVLLHVMKETTAASKVMAYVNTTNAQAAWNDITTHFDSEVVQSNIRNELYQTILSSRIGNAPRGYVRFLNDFAENCRQLDNSRKGSKLDPLLCSIARNDRSDLTWHKPCSVDTATPNRQALRFLWLIC